MHFPLNNSSLYKTPKFKKTLLVSSLNYDFKSKQDREEIVDNFGRFLNSLNFPIQVLCQSKIINSSDWELKNIDENYSSFLRELIDSKNTTEKKFYVSFVGKGEEELQVKKTTIEKGLKRCGLYAEEVEVEEPSYSAELSPNWFYVDGLYHQTLYVENWPHSAVGGWLSDLYNIDKNLSISMFLHPVDNNLALPYIKKRIVRTQSNVNISSEFSDYYGDYDEDIMTALSMRDEIVKNEGKFFFMTFYITVKSNDLGQLKRDVDFIRGYLSGMMIVAHKAFLRQDEGFKCTLPNGVDYLKDISSYTFTTTPLKRFFPFISANVVDEGGIFIGENLLNQSLIFLNHFNYLTSSMVVLGKSGSGKSYAVKSQVMKLVKNDVEVTVLDIEDEFSKLPKSKNLIIKKFNSIAEYREFIVLYWEEVKRDPNKPRFLVIDEFWEFMRDEEIAKLVQEIVKKCRKRWLGICVITQEVEDLLNNECGKSIINNTSIKMLLKVESNQRDVISKVFGLTPSEFSFLVGASEGEGILFAGTNHVQFKTIVSRQLHKEITTKPEELH